jgi:hypothetical protein
MPWPCGLSYSGCGPRVARPDLGGYTVNVEGCHRMIVLTQFVFSIVASARHFDDTLRRLERIWRAMPVAKSSHRKGRIKTEN